MGRGDTRSPRTHPPRRLRRLALVAFGDELSSPTATRPLEPPLQILDPPLVASQLIEFLQFEELVLNSVADLSIDAFRTFRTAQKLDE